MVTKVDPVKERNETELLQICMKENLNQARHVENERLSFLRVYLVLVGIVGALVTDGTLNGRNWPFLLLIGLVFISGLLAVVLTMRWNKVFRTHRDCAIVCYQKLYEQIYDGEKTAIIKYSEGETGVSEEYPLYSFNFDLSLVQNRSTGTWFCIFYGIMTGSVGLVLFVYFLKYWTI